MASYDNIEFKKRMRMSKQTFSYLCQQVAPVMAKKDTSRRRAIPLELKVAIGISWLASGICLYLLSEMYDIGKSTIYAIILDFCYALKEICRDVFIQWPSPSRMKQISQKFQSLHGIPMIAGAIDGSHIPIIAPTYHGANYYNRKGFHFVLLQGVVDYSCCFWDYDIGWCGSIHDWNLFSKSHLGRACKSGGLRPYALLGNAAYQCHHYMFTPYIGHKDGFTSEQQHWNFIQSSSRMCVERAFGMLKLRWRILLKRMDCPIEHVPIHVTACLILHNLIIIHRDEFNSKEWLREAQESLLQRSIHRRIQSQRLRPRSTGEIAAANTLWEAKTVDLTEMEFHNRGNNNIVYPGWDLGESGEVEKGELSMRQDAIAKSLFSRERLSDLCQNSGDHYVGLSSSDSK